MEAEDHEALFKFWLSEGYRFRKPHSVEMQIEPKKYKERMMMEYNIIRQAPGYIDYFLMVSDLVRWAKDRGILVGPGRGSAAGSLCCWLLRITEIDPLLYPMLFERFITLDRPDPPDVDIDFEDERRGEVIQYAQEKYGFDKVANILNFVRYKGRNSLDDIARVYNVPEWKVENIKSKLVERAEGHPRFALTLQDTFDSFDEVSSIVRKTPELNLAKNLEGNYRNASIHPCGIVIGGDTLTNYTALYEKQSGADRGSGIAYDKKDSSYLGLLKVDFLSLTTLSGIRASIEQLHWTANKIGMSITEFYRIPLDDTKVFEAFRAGDVLGIFQFEGHTTRRVLKAVAPDKFMDLVDVNALSRPGGDDQAYIKSKRTGKMPEVNEAAAQHISWTFGTIVYQEQIMLILRDYGNFPAADVNAVRKIISDKQDATILNEYFDRFAEGAVSHGDTRDQAELIWRNILNATGYAFNISHAVCYSDTAYRQMWLKVYHPEFYLGQLQKCPGDEKGRERRRKLIVEAERKGIKVNGPNLDISQANWTMQDGQMYAGWTAVHGIGPKVAASIIDWRKKPPKSRFLPGMHSVDNRLSPINWQDLLEVKGIGQGRIDTIRSFSESDDPFDVLKVKRTLDSIRRDFTRNEFPGVAEPTHTSVDIHTDGDYVTFMGVLKAKTYKDIVQQRLKYGSESLTREKVLATLDDPDLLKYCTLDCDDEHDEPVRIRVGRKKFPQYRGLISKARTGKDVIVASGYVSEFGGIGIQIKELVVIDPE